VFKVIEVHEGGRGEVVIGQVEVADLGRDGRLDARGQRGVADGSAGLPSPSGSAG